MARNFSISGYTTTFNCLEMEYPLEVCINSLLGFCDEVVVVDAGSKDGTIEKLAQIARRESRFKYEVEPVNFSHPRWAIYQDGYLKAKARALCSADYCWQIDTDEIVPEEVYPKIDSLPAVLGSHVLMLLPMVEFWGSFNKIRSDFFCWKDRFSRNDKRIIHGIPKKLRKYDAQGHEYPRPFDSDSCNYIYFDTEEEVVSLIPLRMSKEKVSSLSQEEYAASYFSWLEEFPYVLHISWLNLERKIRHYRKYWPKFHASMYNLSKLDSAENNVMFQKPWSEVTDQDIQEKAKELESIGPRSFHHKINISKHGSTLSYTKPIPVVLEKWVENNLGLKSSDQTTQPVVSVNQTGPRIDISQYPLISIVVTSYKKGPFLRETVGSLLNQDYPHTEILVVSDGSPDETAEVTRQIIRENPDKKIQLLEKENGGVSDSRNFGLRAAQGDYLVLLDGDDKAAPSFLSTGFKQLTRDQANLFYCNVEIFGSQPGEWIPHQYNENLIRYDNCLPILTIFHRQLFEKTGGFKVALWFAEDWEFWLNCSRYNLKATKSDQKLFLYRSNESGIASSYIENGYGECISVVIINNSDLYPVEEVLDAHAIVPLARESSQERAKVIDRIHADQWFLKFWFGLVAEYHGRLEQAIEMYGQAVKLSHGKDWQPIYRIAGLMAQNGKGHDAHELLNVVRALRPDMKRFVVEMQDKIKAGNLSGTMSAFV